MLKSYFVLTVVLSILQLCVCILIDPKSEFVPSCIGASSTKPDGYCSLVSWNHARLYNKTTYSLYSPGIPLSTQEQAAYAQKLTDQHRSGSSSEDCADAIERFFCLQAFPECPEALAGYSTSFFSSCRISCDQATLPGCSIDIDCNLLPTTSCVISVPSGYFALPPENVSSNIPSVNCSSTFVGVVFRGHMTDFRYCTESCYLYGLS